jgi:hypothetical protein
MSQPHIPDKLRATVRERANACCEYCHVPEIGAFFPHQPDHIVATQHGGPTNLENLAFACIQCNRLKGPNIASVDPETFECVRLFNPRTDRWVEHFQMDDGRIVPLTSVARATAALLHFNDTDREATRRKLLRAGQYTA